MLTFRAGPLYMIGATLAFTVMVTLVKVARAELSAWEIIAWRGIVAAPIAALMSVRVGLRPHNVRTLALRCVLGFTAMSMYFTAVKGLPVTDLALITRLQPILVGAMAPLLLGVDERSPWWVWGVLVVGLTGCAILLTPELSMGLWSYGLLAVGGTALAAGAHITLRVLGRTEDPRVVVFWFQMVMLILAVAGTWLQTGRPVAVPSAPMFPVVIGAGLAAVVGQMLLTQAYRVDRATLVAAAGYTGPLWAVLADILVFATAPTIHAVVGGTIVIGAGLALVLKKDQPPPASPVD
jgi:drug/metabolite transporter (DMT)-like permease